MAKRFPKPPPEARVIFRESLMGMPDDRIIPIPHFAANAAGYLWLSKFFAYLADCVGSGETENHIHFRTNEKPFDAEYSDDVEFYLEGIYLDEHGEVNRWMSPDNKRTNCASERFLELAEKAARKKSTGN